MPAFDAHHIRDLFPSLALSWRDEPVVFFDGPGGTQVPRPVMAAVHDFYSCRNSNLGGAFLTSRRADEVLAQGRQAMADFINAGSAEEIAFGANMTTHTFHLSRSIGKSLDRGDEVLVTVMDHEANISPWEALRERGVGVRRVDIDPATCGVDMTDFRRKLNKRTRLLAVGAASNAVGTRNDVKAMTALAHEAGALVFVDAVHDAPHGPIDVRDLDCDFLAFSVYKCFGPHVGVLYGKKAVMDGLPAYKVRPAHDRFETGTVNLEGIAGATAAINYLADLGERFGQGFAANYPGLQGRRLALKTALCAIGEYEAALCRRLIDGLVAIPGIRIWGITDSAFQHRRAPTVGFTLEGTPPNQVAARLGERGIFAWSGHFYAQSLIERLGLYESGGVVRVGLVHYNTGQEVDRFLTAMHEIADQR